MGAAALLITDADPADGLKGFFLTSFPLLASFLVPFADPLVAFPSAVPLVESPSRNTPSIGMFLSFLLLELLVVVLLLAAPFSSTLVVVFPLTLAADFPCFGYVLEC